MNATQTKLWAAIEARKLGGRAASALRALLQADAAARTAGQSRKQRGFRTARGGGQSSKAKGYRHMCAIRDLLLASYPMLHPDDVLVKAGSMGGVDLHLSPAAQTHFPFAVEGKAVESLNIWAALHQAKANVRIGPEGVALTPIVFFTRAGARIYVALAAEDFLHVCTTGTEIDR